MDNACLCNGGQIAIELCDWDRASNHETLRAISPEDSCEIPFGFRHWHPVRENFDETLSPTVQISFKNSTTSSGGAAGRVIDVVVPTPKSQLQASEDCTGRKGDLGGGTSEKRTSRRRKREGDGN